MTLPFPGIRREAIAASSASRAVAPASNESGRSSRHTVDRPCSGRIDATAKPACCRTRAAASPIATRPEPRDAASKQPGLYSTAAPLRLMIGAITVSSWRMNFCRSEALPPIGSMYCA